MLFSFGINRYMPVWVFFMSALLLIFIDSVFFKQQVDVYIIEAKETRSSKGKTCYLTLQIAGIQHSSSVDARLCRANYAKGSPAVLTKTAILGRWVALQSGNSKEIRGAFEHVHLLDWLLCIGLMLLPILSRRQLEHDLKWIYYGGLLFMATYSGYLWLLVF